MNVSLPTRLRLLSAVVLLFVTAAACSKPQPDGKPGAETMGGPAIEELADRSESEDQSAKPLSSEERYVVQAARDRIVSRCMAEKGFNWKVETSRHQEPDVDPYPALDALRRSGYNQDFETALRSSHDLDQQVRNGPLPPEGEEEAYEKALAGTDTIDYSSNFGDTTVTTGGCLSEADITLYGSVENFLWLSESVEIATYWDVNRALMEVPGYEPALREWQTCMLTGDIPWMTEVGGGADWPDWDTGYEVLRLKSVMDDAPPPQTLIDEVIEMDAGCLESSGLHEIREENLDAITEGLWEAAGSDQAEVWKLEQLALENAKQVP